MRRIFAVLLFAGSAFCQIINSSGGGFTPPVVATQSANGATTLKLKAATDSASTGNQIDVQNAAGNSDVFTVDTLGNVVANSVSTGGTPVTGTIGFGSGVADPACTTSFLIWGSTTTANVFKWCDANSNIRTAVDTASTQTLTGKSIAASEVNSGTLAVAQGGTNLASGTSGGILGYTASGTIASSVALTANVLVKGGGAGSTPTNSLVTDDGTTATYTGTGGYSAPLLTSTGSGAGAFQCTAGTAQGHATANTITEECPASATAYEKLKPTAAATGILAWTNAANVVTESIDTTTGSGTVVALAASPVLTTPSVTTINDANGNAFIKSSATASAVDSVTVTNAATANPATVTVAASGTDTNINTSLNAKGSGIVQSSTFFQSTTNRVTMTADWTCGTGGTVSSCVAATIVGSTGTPLTFTLPLQALSWHFQCDLVVGQATATTANNWNLLTATNGATNVTVSYMQGDSATTFAGGATTDQASTTTTFNIGGTWTLGGTATKMPVHISGSIEGASASGTVVSLQLVAPTVADLVTIYRGATCSVSTF